MRQIVFGDCTVELTPDNWNEPKTVKVKAVRDFYNDGTKRMLVDFRPIYTTYLSEFWNNYQLPPVEVRRSKQHSANTLNSEQNGRHFAGDIFTGIFLNKETLEFQMWFKFWCKKIEIVKLKHSFSMLEYQGILQYDPKNDLFHCLISQRFQISKIRISEYMWNNYPFETPSHVPKYNIRTVVVCYFIR